MTTSVGGCASSRFHTSRASSGGAGGSSRRPRRRRRTMSTVTPAEAAGRELGSEFEGELIGPSDASYEEARALFNAMIDKRPALIARCASAADVARAIGFARAHDL